MSNYKNVGRHVEELTGGRMLAPGESQDLSDEQVSDPHNAALIKDGTLVALDEQHVPEATDAAVTLAQENGIPLAAISGTGRGGQILKEDVERHIAEQEGETSE